MRRGTAALAGLALAVLLVVSLFAGAAVPAAAQSAGNASDTDRESRADVTLSELSEPGRQLDNSPPSVRLARDPGLLLWAKHVPAGSLAGSDSRQASKFIRPSTTVKRNEIYLRANLVTVPPGADDLTARVVAYRVGTDENGTARAENVTIREQQVSLEPGFARSTIRLPQVDGDPKRVTVWLLHDGERIATWQFKHRSAATTVDAPLGADASIGDLVGWAVVNVGLWILVGAVVGVAGGLWAVRRARTGPGATGVTWLILGGVPALLVLGLLYFNLVELLVANSALFALVAAPPLALITIFAAPDTGVEKGIVYRPTVTEVERPSGGEGVDYDGGTEKVVRLVDTPDGGKAVVKDGWTAFFARIKGGLATIDNWDQARALTRLSDSSHDWIHVVSPSSADDVDDGELYGYEAPGLRLERPDDWQGYLTRSAVSAAVGLIGWALYPGAGNFAIALGAVLGLGTAAVLSLEGTDGWAVIPWGTKHHRTAYATASELAEEMDAADSVEKSERARMEERASTEARARAKAADYETAYMGEMFGGGAELGEQLVDAADDASATATEQVVAAVERGDLDPEQATALLAETEQETATDGGRDE